MSNIFTDVRRFAAIGGSPHFSTSPRKLLELSKQLVEEEVIKEFLPALERYMSSPSLENLEEAADGAIDGIYVLAFFLVQMGLDAQRLWDIVQAANMAKYPNGVAIRDRVTGKIQKPPGWKPPSFMEELITWNSFNRGETYAGGMVTKANTGEAT